jgi:hypothetical protein
MTHLQWLEAWTSQLATAESVDSLRQMHRWLWSTWRSAGRGVARGINSALRLRGGDRIQPDIPHLFAGQVETADLVFVNINPGWNAERNAIENSIVATSEEDAWIFSRSVFSRYSVEVGTMHWWNQAIGLAWRVICGTAPTKASALEKRAWANAHVAGWELLPLHSRNAGFLAYLESTATGLAVLSSMRSSLEFAIRLPAPVTVVASSAGAKILNAIAMHRGFSQIDPADSALPVGTKAYVVDKRLILSIPRQLVSKYSGAGFDETAAAIRRLRNKAVSR